MFVFLGQWDVTHATSRTAPSRIVQKISHDHGLQNLQHFNINYKYSKCKKVSCFNNCFRDTGLFGIYFVADGHDLNDTSGIMKSVAHEWKHLASAATDEEVAMAKNQLRTNLYQNLETNTQKAGFNAKEVVLEFRLPEIIFLQLLYTGNLRQLSELEAQIQKVDAGAVREAVSRHVYDRDLAAVGVGKCTKNFILLLK